MIRFYILFLITFFLYSCSQKSTITKDNIRENYENFINNKNTKYNSNLFLSEKERNLIAKKYGVDTSDLVNCPVSKNPNDLLQYINECIEHKNQLVDNITYNLTVTKQSTNTRCNNMLVDFVFTDLLENNKATNKHIILFIIPVSKNRFKLFGHKYFEDH
jgi:hypothetical protein